MKKRFDFDEKQPYRLIAVKDLNGNDKVHTRSLYRERINCVAINVHYEGSVSEKSQGNIHMLFVQGPDGEWINRMLLTSSVSNVEEKNEEIYIFTRNSIYVFMKAELRKPQFLDEANLIELYLSIEENGYFAKGFYYDDNKEPHELCSTLHVGMVMDSVLISRLDSRSESPYVCRYFVMENGIEFYSAIYEDRGQDTRILIHNVGNTDLEIKGLGIQNTVIIKRGDGGTYSFTHS